ncbi:MAG: hypothetical protein HUU03_12650 [Planctomycetaceae bacterium]|nr:hypothetical protein [Planctomycetota bacterium]NUO17281.1 hypothetical protein [Planctomycetaceae bacterium]HRJ78826.1 phosphopantothenoylcysteine decarboxylase [Planctomycetota bacterium]
MARQTRTLMPRQSLAGVRLLVTAGPTHEYIDDVRFIGNPSTGRMGLEVARVAQRMGAQVTVVCGPTHLAPPAGVRFVPVISAEDMLAAVDERFGDCDVFIATAAVSDYRPEKRERGKIKKKKDKLALRLIRNPDVLKRMGKRRQPGQYVIGFSLEVDNALDYAREKLERKNCDIMVVTTPAHFGDSREAVRVINAKGVIHEVPPSTKAELAEHLLTLLSNVLGGKEPELIQCFAPKPRVAVRRASKSAAEGGGDS